MIKEKKFFIIFLISIFLILPLTIKAEDTLLQKGIEQYRAENFEEALEIFKEAYKTSPTTTLSFYLGLTYKQTGDLRKAKEYFIESLTKTPKVFDSYVELVEVLYTLDELDEAKKWLSEAEEQKIMPAKIAYLRGLIFLKENKTTEAIASFKRAKEIDKTLTQAADVQIAIALSRERKITEAMEVLKALIQIDPTSEIAEFSKDYIVTLERLKEEFKEWRVSFNVGYLYDDNVVSKPSETIGIPAIDEVTGKSDSAVYGSFRLQYRPMLKGNFTFSSDLNLYTKRYFDNQAYDTVNASLTLTPGYGFKEGAVTLPFEFYYMTLNDKKYMTIMSVRPTINLQVLEMGILQFSVGYAKRDMLRYIEGADPNEDRDSNVYNALLGFYYTFSEGKGLLWTRYEFQIDDTEGRNWKSNSNRVSAGIIYRLIESLNIIGSIDHTWQNFRNISTLSGIGIPGFPDEPSKRKDKVLNINAGLSYDMFKFLRLNLNYTHTRASSNFAIYDYKRNLYSLEFSFNF